MSRARCRAPGESLQRCALCVNSDAQHTHISTSRVRTGFIAWGGLATIYASARASASNSCGAHVCVLVLPRSHDGPFLHPRGSVRAWICVHLIVCADSCSRTHPRAHTHTHARTCTQVQPGAYKEGASAGGVSFRRLAAQSGRHTARVWQARIH